VPELSGRLALVTGGTSGIGYGIALSLAAAGASLVVQDITDQDQAREITNELRAAGAPDVTLSLFDLRDRELVLQHYGTLAQHQNIDIVVNNAGIQRTGALASLDRTTWDEVLCVNLTAAFESMRFFLPGMRRRGYGRVVNIASVHGLVASPEKAPYVAAKHGLIGLTKVAALEYADAGSADTGGVTVNAICPGWSETALIEPQVQAAAAAHGGDRSAGTAALLEAKQPSRRFTRPSEIGALVCLLCSPQFHNINGAAIPIDGAWTAQ
jgi:3-hydroxybutyrate dehydrogenase